MLSTPAASPLPPHHPLPPHRARPQSATTFLAKEPPLGPEAAAAAGVRALAQAGGEGPKITSADLAAIAPRPAPPAAGVFAPSAPPAAAPKSYMTPVKKPEKPYVHGQMPNVNMDMLKDIAILGGQPLGLQQELAAAAAAAAGGSRPTPNQGAWAKGDASGAGSSMAAADASQRSGVPKWLQRLKTREALGGKRRDADQMRLLDLAAEAASQAAYHGLQSSAAGFLNKPGAVIETEGTDSKPIAVRYEDPKTFVAKDALINELAGFLGKAGGATGNVRRQLRSVADEDKKSWFLREADRLRMQQISRHEDRVGAIERMEKQREDTLVKMGIGGKPTANTPGYGTGARNRPAPVSPPPVFTPYQA